MTKEQFKIFKTKQQELYAKYEKYKDPKAHDLLDKEWSEFIKNFSKEKSRLSENITEII